MRVHTRARTKHRRRPAALAAVVVAGAMVMVPLSSPAPAAAQPSAPGLPTTVYDHSKDKGKPGARGPLPPGASRSEISVKFRSDRDVRLRDGQPVAAKRADSEALTQVLAQYPGTTFHRVEPEPEEVVDAERARLEARTGRELPDLNSWFTVRVGGDVEALLADLNALPSVELATARLAQVAPADPLEHTQVYRTGVSPGSGIDADFATGLPGGRGQGITVTDVEAGGYDTAAKTFGAVASGEAHSLMVTRDGTVRAWGRNSSGQLGDGTTTNASVFMPVTGMNGVVQVAAGTNFSMALRSDGTVWTWGAGGNGQLGNGTTTNSTVPVQVTGLPAVVSIAAGSNFAVAVLTNGTMRAWGANASGQLGNGNTTNNPTPTAISGLSSVAVVAAGGSAAAAVLTGHSVRAWGLNSSGQLGNGTTTNVAVPTAVNLPPGAIQIAVGTIQMAAVDYTPALDTDPGVHTYVWAWGANSSGQLGTGNTTASTNPVQSVYLQNLWNTCHEDLANRPAPAGPPVRLHLTTSSPCRPTTGDMHGTHAIGFVGAQADNGLGLDGLLPQARLQLVNAAPGASSIALARNNSQPGDVIWFEVAFANNEGWWPWELAGDVYDQIVMAAAAGITVVEPAGNGGNSLDDSHPYSTTIMARPDSGAIMVGAGEPSSNMTWTAECAPGTPHPAPRTAMGFSTYGSRVNVQGWGKCISTINSDPLYNDLTPGVTDRNRMYYSNFNGTSGASPMVVGAAGVVQGIAKQSGTPLSPLDLRTLLVQTGSPQPAADPRHVGPLPNIPAAVDDL